MLTPYTIEQLEAMIDEIAPKNGTMDFNEFRAMMLNGEAAG